MPRTTSTDSNGMHDATPLMAKAARKTERSHEENQERAYIAASRRADRSIEARVQSARMASEIHKKRTGKGFRITEDIVLKEEMYEEEDDDLPRSFRLLSRGMQTGTPELNARLESYLTNKAAMSHMLARTNEEWREHEVNRLFAASFPNALPPAAASSSMAQTMASRPMAYQQSSPEAFSPAVSPTSPVSPAGAVPPTCYSGLPTPPLQRQGIVPSVQWPTSNAKPSKRRSHASESGAKCRRNSSKSSKSSAKLSRRTSTEDSTSSCASPKKEYALSPQTLGEPFVPRGSAFTTELPPEARMILDGVGADQVLDQTLAGQDPRHLTPWVGPPMFDSMAFASTAAVAGVGDGGFSVDPYGQRVVDSFSKFSLVGNQNSFDAGFEWRTYINDSMWMNDQ